ncbi:MAG: CCDC90 family protein [Candidatus Kuenenia stuttgartiensis]|nr:CCDC90 family protein [Candidatus Kuenenia stuttgartiensis]
MPIINTLEIYEDLKSQFKEDEARTLTKALEKSLEEYQKKQESFLATKDDIAKLREELKDDINSLSLITKNDIANLRSELKDDITNLRSEQKDDITKFQIETKNDMTKLREELKEDINKVRNDLANAKAEIIKWLFIFLIGQGATIISILKFIK